MISRTELTRYCHQLLSVDDFKDYSPNGLQVEGKAEIKSIVFGVTANQALIKQAIALKADAIMVHHGFFWSGEASQIIGIKHQRIKALLQHDINLFAYHLPLDAHARLGNNAQLAQILEIDVTNKHTIDGIPDLLWQGELAHEMNAYHFAKKISGQLARPPLHIRGSEKSVKRVAWCTGAAQRYLSQAIDLGVDAYISGEISENTVHVARESDIHYYAAGHHATERCGIQALANHLSEQFDVACQYVDIDSPV